MILTQIRKWANGRFWARRRIQGDVEIECRWEGCGRKWACSMKGFDHPGNVLHLLNHYAGHEATPEERAQHEREQREGLQRLNRKFNDFFFGAR